MNHDAVREMSNDDIEAMITTYISTENWDFCTDINALAEAEKTLTPEQWESYLKCLYEIISPYDGLDIPGEVGLIYFGMHVALTAPARQRAEALLLTLTEGQ